MKSAREHLLAVASKGRDARRNLSELSSEVIEAHIAVDASGAAASICDRVHELLDEMLAACALYERCDSPAFDWRRACLQRKPGLLNAHSWICRIDESLRRYAEHFPGRPRQPGGWLKRDLLDEADIGKDLFRKLMLTAELKPTRRGDTQRRFGVSAVGEP